MIRCIKAEIQNETNTYTIQERKQYIQHARTTERNKTIVKKGSDKYRQKEPTQGQTQVTNEVTS